MHSRCNPGALLVWSWSTPGGLLVRSWCTLGAFLVHSKCHSVGILLAANTSPFRCWKHDIFLSSRHRTRSAPGWHQECTRIAPGVHQEYQRSAPGVRQECTRRLMTHLLYIAQLVWAKKKTSLYFLDQNSSLITNLRSDSSKMSQKYETSWFYHFKILKITEKSTNLKKSRVRRSFLKILIIDSWSVKNFLRGKI